LAENGEKKSKGLVDLLMSRGIPASDREASAMMKQIKRIK